MKYIEIDQYIANPSTENRDKLVEILGEERFKISDLGVTSRVFSNWKLNNVIPKDDGRQWKNYCKASKNENEILTGKKKGSVALILSESFLC